MKYLLDNMKIYFPEYISLPGPLKMYMDEYNELLIKYNINNNLLEKFKDNEMLFNFFILKSTEKEITYICMLKSNNELNYLPILIMTRTNSYQWFNNSNEKISINEYNN